MKYNYFIFFQANSEANSANCLFEMKRLEKSVFKIENEFDKILHHMRQSRLVKPSKKPTDRPNSFKLEVITRFFARFLHMI